MLVWILIGVIVAAIMLYFLFRDDNSHKAIGILPSYNYSSNSSNTTPSTPSTPSTPTTPSNPSTPSTPSTPVIHPIIELHNLPGSIVTASSYQGTLVPEKGRMNSNSYWEPHYNDDDQWIQFTFPDRYEFSSIQIKYNPSVSKSLDIVDILFARDDEGQFWEEPIRIYRPNNSNAELNHTFNPTMKSKIIRIKIINGIVMSDVASTRIIPIKVGLHGRELK